MTKLPQIHNVLEKYEDKYSIKKKPIFKNRKRLAVKLEKKKQQNLLSIWSEIPFSLIIYTFNPKYFHNMLSYFYNLKEFIIIKNSRKFYKNNIAEKNITGFHCYRIYCNNFLKLYDNIEEILEYNVHIIGLEMHGILYSIEEIPKFLQTIKQDIQFLFNITNQYNDLFNNLFNNIGRLDLDFNQHLHEIFIICQHIINSGEEQEQ